MSQQVSIGAMPTANESHREVEKRSFQLWALIILVAFAVLVLGLHGSLTSAQQLEVFLQSGMYP
jgi:hypothetical protein